MSNTGIRLDYEGGNRIDALNPGEPVTLVAINRPTGYVGTATVPLQLNNGRLDVEIPELALRPPNIKVHAERKSRIEHGATAGDEAIYRISGEGAGLTGNISVSLC